MIVFYIEGPALLPAARSRPSQVEDQQHAVDEFGEFLILVAIVKCCY